MKLKCLATTVAATSVVWTVLAPSPALATPGPVMPSDVPFSATYQADLDGDKKSDTLEVTWWSIEGDTQTWRLKVTTAKGVTSTSYWNTNTNVYFPMGGFKTIDPVKGKELQLVYDEAYDATNARQWAFRVLTWRSNKLVAQKAPWNASASANKSNQYTWFTSTMFPVTKDGFRFYTSGGRRYAEHFMLEWFDSKQRWKGTIRRSKWANGRWYNVKKWTASLTNSQAAKYVPLSVGD